MNVNAVFTDRRAAKAESTPRSDNASRADAASRGDDVERPEEGIAARKSRKPSQAEFSALLALLAGAGPQVRAELHAQMPTDRSSLIDSLLDGSTSLTESPFGDAQADGYTEYVPANTTGGQVLSQSASDHLRYGILKENGAKEVTTALRALTSVGTRSGDDHAQEVLSRITARHAAPVDQLKARGDNKAADLRIALDTLLSQAGTPTGLELAAAASNGNAADHAALAAAAAALASATAASSADVTTPVRDTSALAPELSQRLDRVIARMKSEHGHDVQVVETVRSQDRQDFLFEQGRTRQGAVVTWTRDSAHSQGAAVDVIVDGSWNNAEGYARLQRVAREEGLRTLGERDPGHLELESKAFTGGQHVAAARELATQHAQVGAATAPAGRAGVAQVASVASVAQVATPGVSRGYARGVQQMDAKAESASADGTSAGIAAAPASASGQGNAFGRGTRDEDGKPLNDGRRVGVERRESAVDTEAAAFGALQGSTMSTAARSSDAAAPAAGLASAERVADAQALRDNAPAGSVSRLTLNIDAPEGGQDRITVDLRGNSVGTQISTDVANAERLRMRTAELQDALGRHGLESESVRVAGVARAETPDAARVAVGDRDALKLGAAQNAANNDSLLNQGQRDRAANAREWDRPDTSRQSRDERRESARQGAGQPGQRETPYRSAR